MFKRTTNAIFTIKFSLNLQNIYIHNSMMKFAAVHWFYIARWLNGIGALAHFKRAPFKMHEQNEYKTMNKNREVDYLIACRPCRLKWKSFSILLKLLVLLLLR